jgi:hypothetical protein
MFNYIVYTIFIEINLNFAYRKAGQHNKKPANKNESNSK